MKSVFFSYWMSVSFSVLTCLLFIACSSRDMSRNAIFSDEELFGIVLERPKIIDFIRDLENLHIYINRAFISEDCESIIVEGDWENRALKDIYLPNLFERRTPTELALTVNGCVPIGGKFEHFRIFDGFWDKMIFYSSGVGNVWSPAFPPEPSVVRNLFFMEGMNVPARSKRKFRFSCSGFPFKERIKDEKYKIRIGDGKYIRCSNSVPLEVRPLSDLEDRF